MTQKIRSIDGDVEDVNHYVRAYRIETQLREAVENQPRLVIANQKVVALEKVTEPR
jgi:uncharacterized protein YeeX (DUF496 family)